MNWKLDGREFEEPSQAITAAQNDYVVGNLRLAGAIDTLYEVKPKSSEVELAELRETMLTKIMVSGLKAKIVAGNLTEVGKKWSRAEADRNAERFDAIADVDEQTVMTAALVRLVIRFFQSAGILSRSSPRSSNPSDAVLSIVSAALETSATFPN
jgi:hypothetical protein